MSNKYMPEKARAWFKKSRALRFQNMTEEADAELRKCWNIYSGLVIGKSVVTDQQIVPKKRAEELVDQDFDDLVAFWSK